MKSAIPFILVTGFLGAGKTTLLKHILLNNGDERKIGIIQNEFAPASIDGEDLKGIHKPFEILEINNGSVFCVCLLGDFISSLKAFIEELNPDLVILESSGLSDPIAVAEILQSRQISAQVYLAGSWCIIDVVNYEKVKMLITRVNHQIMVADFLVLNKIDLAGAKLINKVRNDVFKINALARVFETSYCTIDPVLFFNKIHTSRHTTFKIKGFEANSGRPPIQTAVFKTGRKISPEGLKQIIKKYADKTLRIKGYALLQNNNIGIVQTVFDNVNIKITHDKITSTALILMGEEFNLSEFSNDFRHLT